MKFDGLVESLANDIPAKRACPGMTEVGGIYKHLKRLDSGIKFRNDIPEGCPRIALGVITAKAGIYKCLKKLDSAIKSRNDKANTWKKQSFRGLNTESIKRVYKKIMLLFIFCVNSCFLYGGEIIKCRRKLS